MAEMMAPRPRVLHLLSDWQWVEPAPSIVNLCRRLGRLGHVVDLACAQAPDDTPNWLAQGARDRFVDPILDFRLKRSVNPFINLPDIHRLTEFMDREEVQIVHVHTAHDHYIGSRAARRANSQPAVVRTNHRGGPLPPTWLNRRVIRGHTEGWISFAAAWREEDERNFNLNPARSIVVEATVDLDRFSPAAKRPDVRPALGLSPEHVVAGFVPVAGSEARGDVLAQALAKAMKAEPLLRLLVISRAAEGAALRRAAAELGIADRVVFAIRSDERSEKADSRPLDYVDCLAAADFALFLEPGPDGTCPAAREAMAMGKPVVAARSGLLPELVEDGRCGLVVDGTVERLADALARMTRNRSLREKLGRGAATKAKEKFDIEHQVEAIAELYQRLAEGA